MPLDADGIENLRLSLEDGQPQVIAAGFVPPSRYRQAVQEADDTATREIAWVVCPSCRNRQVVAKALESARGTLVRGEIPSTGTTRLAREFARRAGVEGRVPPAVDLVRELIDWPEEERDIADGLPDWRSHCRTHGLVDIAAIAEAVAIYRRTGKKKSIPGVLLRSR